MTQRKNTKAPPNYVVTGPFGQLNALETITAPAVHLTGKFFQSPGFLALKGDSSAMLQKYAVDE